MQPNEIPITPYTGKQSIPLLTLYTRSPMEARGHLSRGAGFMELPEALITRILCYSAPKYISSASKTCKYFNRLLNSPEFLKTYQDSRHKSGCMVSDNFFPNLPKPHLYIYDIISHQWNTIAVADLCPLMLNPQMASASGGLMLFSGNEKRSIYSYSERTKEVVVAQLFTKRRVKLPDPPLGLLVANCAMEIVVDDTGSSYKVIIVALTLTNQVFWVYDSCTPDWKVVFASGIIPLVWNLNRIVSSRSFLHRGVLYWFIVNNMGTSCLNFFDTECDVLRRPTLSFSRGETFSLCGITVCGGNIMRVSKESRWRSDLLVSQLNEENGGSWEPLFESRVLNLGQDLFSQAVCWMAVCSSGEEMLCLVSVEKGKESYGQMFERHMLLLSCNLRDGKWQQLSSSSTGECDDNYLSGVTEGFRHRSLSQAKWMNFKYSGPI